MAGSGVGINHLNNDFVDFRSICRFTDIAEDFIKIIGLQDGVNMHSTASTIRVIEIPNTVRQLFSIHHGDRTIGCHHLPHS